MFQTISQSDVKPGMVLMVQGYEWVVDRVRYCPPKDQENHGKNDGKGCYRFTCHWSGRGIDPKFFNDNFVCGQREDLTVTIKK